MGCSGRSGSGAKEPPAGPAAEPTRTSCDALPEAQGARAGEILAKTYIYDCCDETLAGCLQHEKRCLLAVRLAENICRRVAEGQDEATIELALSLRERMMQAEHIDEPVKIDLEGVPPVGDPGAVVTLVGYAAPRGEHCARMTPLVHEAVTAGALKGKARLYVKPFPMKSNPHSKEAGVAFLAALELGKFWEFVLHSYAHFDEFSLEVQPEWAEAVGLDREEFEKLLEDPEIVPRLAAGKMEGLENGVESTPAYFIDGRFYQGEMEYEELVDVTQEMYEHAQGLVHEQ